MPQMPQMHADDARLVEAMDSAVRAVRSALAKLDDWGLAGTKPGQHLSDLAADAAAVPALADAGLAVMSEESGWAVPRGRQRPLVAVLDPLDGSTNAARGIPWYATSICVLDADGPRAAVVANLATGVRYTAVRGEGAQREGPQREEPQREGPQREEPQREEPQREEPQREGPQREGPQREEPQREGASIAPSEATHLARSVVGLSGFPARHLGWSQFRSLGAAALDLCAVAEGVLDAYVVVGSSLLGPWDYLGGMLVCTEAGAVVRSLGDGDLVVTGPAERRALAAAATPGLLDELMSAVVSMPAGERAGRARRTAVGVELGASGARGDGSLDASGA